MVVHNNKECIEFNIIGINTVNTFVVCIFSWYYEVFIFLLSLLFLSLLFLSLLSLLLSNTITNPIWLVKTRFQLLAAGQTQFKTYGEIIKTIYKEEGIPGFFKGLTASYIGCTEGAIQWIVYEKLKQSLEQEQNNMKKKITPVQYARASSAAKFVAILMTYPHEVVRTRLREQGTRYKGFMSTLKIIAREEGMNGLYGGVGLHLLRSVPNAAIMFVTFELVSNYLQDKIDNGLPLFPKLIAAPIKKC